MAPEAEVALLGTGVAPLVAASRLIAEGKSVLLLNPDFDFFREDSELPLEPLWPLPTGADGRRRLERATPERAVEELRPNFPGALELWPPPVSQRSPESGYRDRYAPHVRSRSRLWIRAADAADELDDVYLGASEVGLKPQLLEGMLALKRFPGNRSQTVLAERAAEVRGVVVPKGCDVDVARYRNGVLEFVRERLPSEQIVRAAAQIEPIEGGVRYHAGGKPHTARLSDGLLVFWTPRLTSWVLAQARRVGAKVPQPRGVRLWEEWSIVSRGELDPEILGGFEDLTIWAEAEGEPASLRRLSILRPGALSPFDPTRPVGAPGEAAWASSDSFRSLSRFCYGFLKWEKFSVRSMRPRAIFEWAEPASPRELLSEPTRVRLVMPCDGPLPEVVHQTRMACDELLSGGGA